MKRILIVDDALDLGRLWQAAIKAAAPEVDIVVVPSAEEALLEANYHSIDLLITDIRLPGMDGLELVERIRKLHEAVKVVLVTGYNKAEYQKAVKKLEPDAYFEKPFDLEALIEKVMRFLGMKGIGVPDLSTLEEVKQEDEPVLDTRLSDVLVDFRQEVNALAVILLDEEGKLVELCGDIPVPEFERDWVPSMMSALQAGGAVSRLMGEDIPAQNILAFSGKTFDLMLLAPVAGYALVSILKSGRTALRPAVAFEAISVVQAQLVKMLTEMGIEPGEEELREETATEEDVPAEKDAPLLEEGMPEEEIEPEEGLEALLSQSVKQDADAFWDAAPDVNVKTDEDTLTFEEAVERGLTKDNS